MLSGQEYEYGPVPPVGLALNVAVTELSGLVVSESLVQVVDNAPPECVLVSIDTVV